MAYGRNFSAPLKSSYCEDRRMDIDPALVFARDDVSVSSSESGSPDDGSCDACVVVADLVTLISGSVYESPTYKPTEITVGNTQFSFSYTSLFDDFAAASSLAVPSTMYASSETLQRMMLISFRTSPVQVWSISAYTINLSRSSDGACSASNGVHDQDFFGASVATSGDLNAQLSAYQQAFANQLGNNDCQGGDSDSGITSISFPTQAITTTEQPPQSLPLSTSMRPGSSISAVVQSTESPVPSDTPAATRSSSTQYFSSTSTKVSAPSATQATEASLSVSQSLLNTFTVTTKTSSSPETHSALGSSGVKPSSSATTSNSSPTTTASTSPGPHSETKIGLAVGTAIGVLIVVLLVLILWRLEKRHKKKAGAVERKRRRWSKDWIPWLQRKGELHAEGRLRSELEAYGMQCELEAEHVYEVPTVEQRHELKSEECAQEMEISEKICNVDDGKY